MILNILMSIAYTFISIISAFSNAGAAAQDSSQAWSLADYYQKVESRTNTLKTLTFGLLPADRIEVEFDETLSEMFEELERNSGVSAEDIINTWPDLYYYNRWVYALMPGMVNTLRDNILGKADQYEADQDWTRMALYRMLGISAGMPEKVRIVAEETAAPGVYAIVIYATYGDGSVARMDSKAQYNKNSGYVYQNNDGAEGIVGLGYNMNIRDSWAYTSLNPPQRVLGYTKAYDDAILKTTDMVDVDTLRLKFPYQGRDWMLQLWKGRYFITTGGEVGIYNKPTDRLIDFYDAATDAERIGMSFRVTADTGDVLIDRPITLHWWMTGFSVRPNIYGPSRLTLQTDITPTDAEMMEGLCAALEKEFANGALTYALSEDNTIVSIVW